ncbi:MULTISPECIES: AAA family ATPase [Paraburkholderia]|uniref:AAA family ATPase n=1 Tax=Paraburkholderia podalyriae TaxID=1938811 RepID=A0ABR7PHE2_9BURK|nr:AAA family ATPase [Paraburkholderia podalyriae]MBC8745798.1 AAA family ATPase [Paraburkholderia podalyriae]
MIANQLPEIHPQRLLSSVYGQGNLGVIRPVKPISFEALKQFVSMPKQSPMSHTDFMALSNKERGEAKKRDPFVVFGAFDGNQRNHASFKRRSALTLDFDKGTADLFAALVRGDTLAPFDYLWHTTRSHTPEAPRLRIIIPSIRDMSREEHRTVALAIATFFRATLDPGSLEAERAMYCPIQNQGAEYRFGVSLGGGYLNPDSYLAIAPCETAKPVTAEACNDVDFSLLEAKQSDPRWTLGRVKDELLSRLDPNADEWNRARWLKLGMILHHQFDGSDEGLELWDTWSAKDERVTADGELMYQPGLCEREWESFGRTTNVATIGTLVMWVNEVRATDTGQLREAGITPTTARFPLRSADELANAPPMKWLVRAVLPLEGLAALFGPSGSGKSFLVLDIAAAVAGGNPEWFGHRVLQCPVTYCALEGEAGMGKRVKAWAKHHDKPLPDGLRFMTAPFDLLDGAGVAELARSIASAGGAGGMVVLDTLNRAAPGADENSSVDMGNMITAAKRLQNLLGGLVLLVHHTGKDATKGLRGHSSLHAALDGAIEVNATESRREWVVAKSKDDETGAAHRFKLLVVDLGNDDCGEPVTSCVIAPDESIQPVKGTKLPTGGNQKIAFDAVTGALRNSFESGQDGAPKDRACIPLDEAVALVTERMLCDQKHKKQRAIEALNGLVAKNIFGVKSNSLWRA